MATTFTSLNDIGAVGSWTDIRQMSDYKLTLYEQQKEKDRLLDSIHKIINSFDHKWLLARLNSQKMKAIKKHIQLESLLDPNVYDFIDVIVKSFGKHNPVSVLCLALGAHSLFFAVKAQNQKNFSYKMLVDFILLVGMSDKERG